jgi:hypothetical protein
MNAFPNGLPRDAQGNINQNAMLQTYAKIKGADAVPGLLPLLIRQQALLTNEQGDYGGIRPETTPQLEGTGTSPPRNVGAPSAADTGRGSVTAMEPGDNPLPAANDRPVPQTDDAGRYPGQCAQVAS